MKCIDYRCMGRTSRAVQVSEIDGVDGTALGAGEGAGTEVHLALQVRECHGGGGTDEGGGDDGGEVHCGYLEGWLFPEGLGRVYICGLDRKQRCVRWYCLLIGIGEDRRVLIDDCSRAFGFESSFL